MLFQELLITALVTLPLLLAMAAPAHTTRNTPVGQPMRDGYRSLIAFAANANVLFWEKGVTPPGLDGGESIEASTMHNGTWRTFGTPSLITLTDLSTRVAYDPALYDDILSLVNVEGAITVHFPTGGRLSFFGRLQSFEPDELVEGTQPEASVTIAPTNWDPVNNVEEPPVFSGT